MDKGKIKNFADQVYVDAAGAMVAGLCYIGIKTGLFKSMVNKGAMSLEQVVEASGLQSRYVEEWLKGLASASYLEYETADETFEFPDEHAYLLASEGTDHYAGGLFLMTPLLLGFAPKIAEAFRSGGGVPFEEIGHEGLHAIEAMSRGQHENRLASYWLSAMPGVVSSLEQGGSALDVGCGTGAASLSLARAYPKASFTGVDLSADSVKKAQKRAAAEGLDKQVSFVTDSVGKLTGSYDFISLCDVLHDLSDPVTTLSEIKTLLKAEGTLLVMEPKVADRLEDNKNPISTMYYGFSVFHCMTQSLAKGGVGLGTCLGPKKTQEILSQAGFSKFEILDIKSQVNLFYAVGH